MQLGCPDLAPVSCCVPCHFAWEEREVFPYLPWGLRRLLMREHDALERLGFPQGLVDEHAGREMERFLAYCPAKIVALVDADHGFLCADGPDRPECGCPATRPTAAPEQRSHQRLSDRTGPR